MVGDVMKKNVVVAPSTSTVLDAAKLMAVNKIGSVVIIDKDEAVGMLTERDIIRKVIAKGKSLDTQVKEVMSAPLVVVTPDTSVEDAARAMKDKNIRRLPVINKEKFLVGIITDRDIIRILPSLIDIIEESALATY